MHRTPTELWLDAHYDRHGRVAAQSSHAHPELGRQEFATTQFVASQLADAGLNPKVLPGGTGLTCDFGPSTGRGSRCVPTWTRCRWPSGTGAPYASGGAQRRPRLRARRAHRDPAGRGAGPGVGARTAGRRAADLPGRRGADARRRDRRHRGRCAGRACRASSRCTATRGWPSARSRCGRARSRRPPTSSRSRCIRPAATRRGRT